MLTHFYSERAKQNMMVWHGSREVVVTMSANDYKTYCKDFNFKSDDALLNWINETWGILGTVTEIDVID